MTAAMSAVMLAGAATGACCSVWSMGGTRLFALLLNALMGVLSLDLLHAALAGTTPRVPLVVGAAALVAAAMAAGVAQVRSPVRMAGHHRAMGAHRSIGAIVMAVALLVPLATGPVTAASGHSHGGASSALTVILVGGTALVALLAVVAILPLRGRERVVAVVDAVAMTGSCAVMTAAHWPA